MFSPAVLRFGNSLQACPLVFWGYLTAAILMCIAAGVEAVIGIDAEQRSLESVGTAFSAG